MHYEKQSFPSPSRSAHFRYRRDQPAALSLFDEVPHGRPELGDVERIALPSVHSFLAAHHRAHETRTLDADDIPPLVNACTRILRLLADEQWHRVTEVRDVAQVLSYDRRLRDLRRLSANIAGVDWYVHIDARRVSGDSRLYEYRARLESFPQTQKGNLHE